MLGLLLRVPLAGVGGGGGLSRSLLLRADLPSCWTSHHSGTVAITLDVASMFKAGNKDREGTSNTHLLSEQPKPPQRTPPGTSLPDRPPDQPEA